VHVLVFINYGVHFNFVIVLNNLFIHSQTGINVARLARIKTERIHAFITLRKRNSDARTLSEARRDGTRLPK